MTRRNPVTVVNASATLIAHSKSLEGSASNASRPTDEDDVVKMAGDADDVDLLEEDYLRSNPDVALAVKSGVFESGPRALAITR